MPTSLTIGISSPRKAQERLRLWTQQVTVRAIKIKLGSPQGRDADKAMFDAVQQQALESELGEAKLSVDANGGWTADEALLMIAWLAERGVVYVEQPLAQGQEDALPAIYQRSPLPIVADESCFSSRDIPALVGRVHGVNIKLMKSGGLSEARRMVHTAQAHGLKVMFGCYSDSALSNAAAAQLAPFADYLDLDSHLNLLDDPFIGPDTADGLPQLSDAPGLGISRRDQET